jgi:hypothetical protein
MDRLRDTAIRVALMYKNGAMQVEAGDAATAIWRP